ncbi:uncharacterized protein METZ01_LOCUS422335 [marine metagenome]|uniref:Uncharacterized protein n=1 Tax=marine metagenome TaxID=408172 RepID=A0A382XGE9_9ZZZZ
MMGLVLMGVEIYDVPRSIVCCTILELLFGMWSTL